MKVFKLLPTLLVLTFFTQVSTAQVVRYVSPLGSNANSGLTEADPYATIVYAISSASPGDTVKLLPGNYNEQLNINKSITLCSKFVDTGDTSYISATSIDGSGIYNPNPLVQCLSTSYLVNFIGLTFKNSTNISIDFNNFQNSLISDCRFIDNGNATTWGVVRISGNVTLKNSYFSNNRGRYILTSGGDVSSGFCMIHGNVFERNGTTGDIQNWGDKGVFFPNRGKFFNNLMFDNFMPAITTGANGNLDTTIIANNTIYGNHTAGIYFQNWYGGTYSEFYNNIIENNTYNIYFSNSGYSIARFEKNLIKPYFYNTPSPYNFLIIATNNDTINSSGYTNANITTKDFTIPLFSHAVLGQSIAAKAPSSDLYGNPRPNPSGTIPDLGAIESPFAFGAPYLTSAIGANTQATLTWNIVNHPSVTKYRIFMSESPIPDSETNGIIVDNLAQAVNTYIATGLNNLTTYYFRIQSGDNSGNWSGMSNQLSVVPSEPPSVPQITSALKGPRRAYIEWSPSVSNYGAVVYDVFKGTNLSSMTLVSNDQVSTSFIEINLSENIEYFYQIKAQNIYGSLSPLSEADSVVPNRIWYLSPTGTNDPNLGFFHLPLSTMTYANNMAIAGDTIILKTGTYTQAFSANKSLTIGSLMLTDASNADYYIENTIIDGSDQGMLIQNNQNYLNRLDLVGFTIQNCPGAVIEYNSGMNSTISNMRFMNNGNPGAQVVNLYGNSVVKNCYFEGNVFSSLITLNAAYGGFPKVLSSEFRNNGTAAYMERSIIYTFNRSIISNNLIYNNIGVMLNGGCNGPLDSLIIEHNTVVGNQGYGMVLDHCGGGVKGYINNNIIENNTLGCLRFMSNGGGYSIIRLRNNKFEPNPYYTNNPSQYNMTWTNNDTISGLTFNYPIINSAALQLPNYSNSVGSGYTLIQNVSSSDFVGGQRPVPSGSNPDRGAIENALGSPANAAPVINAVSNVSISEDIETQINLSGIGDGDYFSSQDIIISASSDNLSLMPDPAVSYSNGASTAILTLSPQPNQSGTLNVTLVLQDNGGTLNGGIDQTTISFMVTILPVNDVPVAGSDIASTNEDTPVTINVITNDNDIDGNIDPASVQITSPPSNGVVTINNVTGEVTYTPNFNFNGTDSYTYQVCDNGSPLPALCDEATVTISVNPVNDAPAANNDNAVTNEETAVQINVLNNDTDVDGNTVQASVAIVSGPANGTVTVNTSTGAVSYTPNLNFNGSDSFVYQVCDNGAPLPSICDEGTVTIAVNAVNDAPTINDDSAVTNEDESVLIDVLVNDTDVDGNFTTASVTIISGPFNGIATVNPLTGAVSYSPNLNFNGSDSFVYQVCDDGTPSPGICGNGTVTITVNSVNDTPSANNDSAETNEETAVVIDILSNDSDVDENMVQSSVSITSGPANGTVTVNPSTGAVTYTPNLNFNGSDSFVYQVCDNGAPLPVLCDEATVEINVNQINDSPTMLTLSANTLNENEQNTLIGVFSTQDIDDGDSFIYELVDGVGSTDNGLFTVSGAQLFNAVQFDYETQNTFSIRVRSTDAGGMSVEEIFNIEVINVNDIQINFNSANTYCNGNEGIGWINSTFSDYNGALTFSWVGPNGFTSDQQNISNLEAGQYTLTVTDNAHSQSASAMIETIPVYDGLEVCYVTSDTINTQRNRIYFSNPGMYNVEKYQILRESAVAGVYDLIGQVNASDTSFLDNGSDNSAVSYKYRVRSLDSCGNFSVESAFHKTILLQANLGLNNTVNLNWSAYEGVPYSTYVIYRSTNGSAFEELISLPTSNTTFNDVTADVSSNSYVYYVAIPISNCDFTKIVTLIRSNEKNLSPLSVNEYLNEQSLSVYPNPTIGSVTVEANWIMGEEFAIYDLQGRLLLKGRFTTLQEKLDLKNLARGQYILRVGNRDWRITKE